MYDMPERKQPSMGMINRMRSYWSAHSTPQCASTPFCHDEENTYDLNTLITCSKRFPHRRGCGVWNQRHSTIRESAPGRGKFIDAPAPSPVPTSERAPVPG